MLGHNGSELDIKGEPVGFDITEIMIAGHKLGYNMAIMPLKAIGLTWGLDELRQEMDRCIILGKLKDTDTDHAMFFENGYPVNDNDAIANELEMDIEALITGIIRSGA